MYWKSQLWPFHVRLKVVQCILIPMLLYFLPLLPWSKKALQDMLQPIRFMLWRKGEMMGVTWISWDHLATPKRLGGAAILNLEKHLMARRFALLRDICQQDQPWISMMQYFIELEGLVHGKEKLRSQFNRLFRLGVVHLEDVVDNESQRLSEFEDAKPKLRIYLGYNIVA